ncbi:thiosulfate sulfurtransferase/rhodanese-like domain-containing protein 3 [Gadus morhua]|uniref:Sulfurtransferase n=1 Tax=Gadus morhua TaxID=8049 RepID=A0A8C5AJS3_GADMO|nr:thiosulfate sulfurtransferase/rhodanese-like domain-containing protein 3 [Gadus morhua]
MALRGCWRYAGVIPRLLLLNSEGVHVACLSTRPLGSLPNTRSSISDVLPTKWSIRNLSSTTNTDVSYDQLKQDLAGRTAVVIDVREPWELREYGTIPGSINVPLAQVDAALQLNPEDFKERYGGDMPEPADKIVFSCLAGIRSKKALNTAALLGYKDVLHYPGGWQEWAQNEQLKPN